MMEQEVMAGWAKLSDQLAEVNQHRYVRNLFTDEQREFLKAHTELLQTTAQVVFALVESLQSRGALRD